MNPLAKALRERARQFYERARQAVRYGALSTRVARSLLRLKSAFRRNAQQASQLYEKSKIWLTSSTWGGWWSAVLLLAVVFGVGALYLYFIPKDAVTIQHLEFYAVIVIGIGSLYIAGTGLWEKRGSAFFVEYQAVTNSSSALFLISFTTSEELIGNPANSTMPYVKEIYILNEKNKHEAIKRILLKLPNGETLILKEYDTADALLIKAYEAKQLKLNAVTIYREKYNGDNFVLIQNEETLANGEFIIETMRGQSYIRSNKKSIVSYEKEKTLVPMRCVFNEDGLGYKLIFGFNVLSVNEISLKENFINNHPFYNELIEEFNHQGFPLPKFNAREGAFKIQITLYTDRETSSCYSFRSNKKIYTFPMQEKLKKEFSAAYDKNDYNHLSHEDFYLQFLSFCSNWATKKWGKGKDSIVHSIRYIYNPFAAASLNVRIIDDEEP